MYVDIIGWVGVVLTLLAYALLNFHIWKPSTWMYQASNIVGGLCLAISAIYYHDLANIAVNILWMLIGVVGLLKHLKIIHPYT